MSFFEHIPIVKKQQPVIKKVVIPDVKRPSFITQPAPKIEVAQKRQEKASKIESSDMLSIDNQIKIKLKENFDNIGLLEEELSQLVWIETNGVDEIERSKAKSLVLELRRKIQDLERGSDLALYLFRSSSLIESYKLLEKQLKKNSFIVQISRDDNKVKEMTKITLEYLRIAREYIDIESFKQKPQKLSCESCHGINLIPSEGDSSILTCKDCGIVLEILDDAPSFKDSERVNMASRYTYTCKGHFVEAMNRFEGKQNVEIKPDVIKTLNNYLNPHGLTKETATKDHIYMFLSENKFSDYYADINLIYFLITGVNPPDITSYRNELLEMHDEIEEAYSEVKDKERLNSLNVNWKLYKLLQLLDYPCKKDDFFCLKTPAKQGEHEEKWYDMIEYLKTKYPNSITSHGKKRWRHLKTL